MYMYVCICTCMYVLYIQCILGVGKGLKIQVHFYNLHVRLIMWACSRKVEAVLLAAFILFLSPAMTNLDRNSDMNNTNTHYNNPVLEVFYTQSR